jgi:hypothetical protein
MRTPPTPSSQAAKQLRRRRRETAGIRIELRTGHLYRQQRSRAFPGTCEHTSRGQNVNAARLQEVGLVYSRYSRYSD